MLFVFDWSCVKDVSLLVTWMFGFNVVCFGFVGGFVLLFDIVAVCLVLVWVAVVFG